MYLRRMKYSNVRKPKKQNIIFRYFQKKEKRKNDVFKRKHQIPHANSRNYTGKLL